MATDEERAARVGERLAEIETVAFGDTEELLRYQATAAFTDMGVPAPVQPSSLFLRLDGPAIVGHAAPAQLAATLIEQVQRVVRASGRMLRGNPLPSAFDLFLSPQVRPGSTILELFSRAENVEVGQLASTTGTPAVFDSAVRVLLQIIDDVDVATPGSPVTVPITTTGGAAEFGKQLFGISRLLVNNSLDLDLIHRTPSGRATSVSLHRDRARAIHDALDVESTEVHTERRTGLLTSLSLSGTLEVLLDSGATVSIRSDESVEPYRDLFARRVSIAWSEVTVSHPQRDAVSVARTLGSMRLVGETEFLSFDEPPF